MNYKEGYVAVDEGTADSTAVVVTVDGKAYDATAIAPGEMTDDIMLKVKRVAASLRAVQGTGIQMSEGDMSALAGMNRAQRRSRIALAKKGARIVRKKRKTEI